MAIQGPIGKENLDIAFRLRSKTQLFDGSSNPFANANCSNIAAASCHGLVFSASSKPELIVVCLKDLEREKATELPAPRRIVPIAAPSNHIAVNCDSSLLAVAIKLNGIPHIQLYSVQSFLTPNIQKLREFPLSTDNSDATQLCWNPVINNLLTICTGTGQLNMFTIKEGGVDHCGIDPNFKAKCCCWSPKGKQIVVGFVNGKLVQFTPELKPAKIVDCPAGIMPGNFDTISIQWLSTFQFAVAFLSHEPNSRPILHIINAPKGAVPAAIAYNDVCFSSSELRPSKIYLIHVMQWNLLIVASSNSIDVSFLRISHPGDIPTWTQEFPNDLYPAEMPLTASKDESFPAGFDIDIGCSNKVLREDGNAYPVMPMLHVMSTEGVLCSFYIMNTMQSYVDICSPPRPLDPNSANLFQVPVQAQESIKKPLEPAKTPPNTEIKFSNPVGQSTPAVAKVQPKPTFALPASVPQQSTFGQSAGFSFGAPATSAPTSFSLPATNPPIKPFGLAQPTETVGFGIAGTAQPQSTPLLPKPTTTAVATPQPSQPLITVPPTFNPQSSNSAKVEVKSTPTSSEDEQIFTKMINDEMKAFELELQTVLKKSKSLKLNIGTKEESAGMRKKLEELDELKKEATEMVESLRSDVQLNRLGMTEMFSMFYEAKSKFEQSNNEKSIFLHHQPLINHGNKRTVDRLVNQLSMNEMQLDMANQAIYGQWSSYQDEMKKKKKNQMHNPCLEELYHTLTKNQEIIYKQTEMLALLKSKLGMKDSFSKLQRKVDPSIEKLSDSIISMSLVDQVQNDTSKLTKKKLKNLRNSLENRETTIIKPQRPDRPGLNSEIIREKKLQAIKTMKKVDKKVESSTPVSHAPVKPITTPQSSFSSPITSFPQAKTEAPKFAFSNAPKPVETLAKSASNSSFSFGNSSPSSIAFGTQAKLETPKPAGIAFSPASTAPTFSGASFGNAQPSFGFGAAPSFGGEVTKKEEPKKQVEPPKPPSTIENANISVSSTFTIPLANKVIATPPQPKETPKLTEKKEDPKTESASFTFKLSDKKDEPATVTIKAPPSNPTIGSIFAAAGVGAGDPSKPFSFSSAASPSIFGSTSTQANPSSTKSTPSFSFGNAATGSTTLSSFGSPAFSLNLGSDDKTKTTDSPKPASSFSFASASPQVAENKTITSTATATTSENSKPATTFSFASAPVASTTSTPTFGNVSSSTITTAAAPAKTESSFSFTSAIAKATTTTPSSFSFGSPSVAPVISNTPTDLSKSSTVETKTTESPLQGLTVCSPDVKPAAIAPTNIFSPSVATTKSETSSIFGGSSTTFGGFGTSSPATTTQASIFGAQTTTSTQSPSIFGSQTPQTSVFGQNAAGTVTTTTSATSPSIFNLSLGGEANKTTVSPTAATGGPFSLVKPDQSVFGSPSPTTNQPTSPFGASSATNTFGSSASTGIFASAQSNVFGTPPTQTASTGGVFASTQSNVFGTPATSTSTFGQQSSVFGQNSSTPAGIFSQSSFASPTTASSNVFGGNSSFGGSAPASGNIFAQAAQQPQQSTGSIFGNQSTFGQNASSGGSIFGGSSSLGNATSPFGSNSVFGGGNTNTAATSPFSNSFGSVAQSGFGSPQSGGSIFGQQQPAFGQTATFGGSASFGNKPSIFGGQASAPSTGQTNSMFEQLGSQQTGGSLFGGLGGQPQQQQQQQPQPGGFSGSAFSSWR